VTGGEAQNSETKLTDMVREADKVFWECRWSAPNPQNTDFAVLVLYRHMTEMADGMDILARNGTDGPMIPLLRTMLEALISLAYILYETETYGQKALSWLCCYIHQELALKDLVDPTSDLGKEFRKRTTQQLNIILEGSPQTYDRSKEVSESLRKTLAEPHMKLVEEEYQRCKGKKKNAPPPKWYHLFVEKSKRPSLGSLAEKVSLWPLYKLDYQLGSNAVHGSHAARMALEQEDGSAEFKPLRSQENIEHLVDSGGQYLEWATKLMQTKFLQRETHQ
jgi:Family of unknown function (DUF5677)